MWLSNSEINRLSDSTEKRAVKINVKKKIPLKKSSYLAAINYLAVFFKRLSICLLVYGGRACHSESENRGTSVRTESVLPSQGSCGMESNSGLQAWQQVLLQAAPSDSS